MQRTQSTLAFLRSLRLENSGGQKTAITINQAAKLFTISNLGALDQVQHKELHTGQEIDAAYSQLFRDSGVPQETVAAELNHWTTWLSSGSSRALTDLAQRGFMLLPDMDGEGNTDQRINYYDTDKTLNRGDFESPDFNGKSTHA